MFVKPLRGGAGMFDAAFVRAGCLVTMSQWTSEQRAYAVEA